MKSVLRLTKNLILHYKMKKGMPVESLPYFDIHRYNQLISRPVSLVCSACGGGQLLHNLGLRFDSPFVNVRIGLEAMDFFDLCDNLFDYMQRPPSTEPQGKWKNVDFDGWESRTKLPLLWYDHIAIHGFHYHSQEEMLEIWERRRQRFHPENVVIMKMLCTEKEVARFEKLEIKHKIGFHPYPTACSDIITVPYDGDECDNYAYSYGSFIFNQIRSNQILKYFDVFKFLGGYSDYKI